MSPGLAASGSPLVAVVTGALLAVWLIGGYLYRYRLIRSGDPSAAPIVEGVDPGWRPALIRMGPPRSPGPPDPLTMMRVLLGGFVLTWIMWSFVVAVIVPWSTPRVGTAPWLVAAVGLLSMIGIRWVRGRRLNPVDEASLPEQFRTTMFLGLSFAEPPGLVGVAAALATQSLWVFLIGLAFSLVDMALIAPGRREIARRQRQLVEEHSSLDLTRALMARPRQGEASDPGALPT